MQKLFVASLLLSAGLSSVAPLSISPPGQAKDKDVIAVERAALDRWGKGDPSGYMTLYANDVTYFDPSQDRRVDGLPKIKALYEPLAGKFKIDRYVMEDPKVQRHGDVAVLTYNLQNYMKQPDGKELPATRWNATAVFRRIDGKWRTIHAHWAFTKAGPPGPSR